MRVFGRKTKLPDNILNACHIISNHGRHKSFLIGLISFILLGIGFLALSLAAMFFLFLRICRFFQPLLKKGCLQLLSQLLKRNCQSFSSSDVDFEQLKLACQNPELVSAASQETQGDGGDRMMQFNMQEICAKVSAGEISDVSGFKTELSRVSQSR